MIFSIFQALRTQLLKPTYKVFEHGLREKLIILLDPNTIGGNNWKGVASEMLKDFDTVKYIASKDNPTKMVLNLWENQHETPPKVKKRQLSDFTKILGKIGRLDAATETEEYMKKGMPANVIS